jgi:hypothetical protein
MAFGNEEPRCGANLSGRETTRHALSGGDDIAFAPLAWESLPAFVRATSDSAFWHDLSTSLRLLNDAVGVTSADALVIPLLPQVTTVLERGLVGLSPDDLIGSTDAVSTVAIIERLAAIGAVGVVAEVPSLRRLEELLGRVVIEDLEDAMSDLLRSALEAGADAVCVRTAKGESLERALKGVAPIVEFFGATAIALTIDGGISDSARCGVSLLGPDGTWPVLDRGVVFTSGDVTTWWEPDEMRRVLASRVVR